LDRASILLRAPRCVDLDQRRGRAWKNPLEQVKTEPEMQRGRASDAEQILSHNRGNIERAPSANSLMCLIGRVRVKPTTKFKSQPLDQPSTQPKVGMLFAGSACVNKIRDLRAPDSPQFLRKPAGWRSERSHASSSMRVHYRFVVRAAPVMTEVKASTEPSTSVRKRAENADRIRWTPLP
jgi:hypothetical protein